MLKGPVLFLFAVSLAFPAPARCSINVLTPCCDPLVSFNTCSSPLNTNTNTNASRLLRVGHGSPPQGD